MDHPNEREKIGTVNPIAWAVQIRAPVDAEFDRVRKVLESVAIKQSPEDGTHLQAIIRILEDKRAEVMENEQAGYFIQDWQELRDQVRQLIIGDPRYKAIKAAQKCKSVEKTLCQILAICRTLQFFRAETLISRLTFRFLHGSLNQQL